MNRFKVLGKIAAAILLTAIVIVGAIAAYLNTGHAQRLILDRVNGTIPGTVTLENIRFSLLAGSVDLHNPVILSPSGEKLAGCKRLYADVEWTALLYRTFAVADVLIESPWGKLRLNTSGRVNLMQALLPPKSDPVKPSPRPAMPAGILGAVVKSVRILNGRLQFTADRQQAHLDLKGIDVEANADILKKTGQLKLSARSGEFQSPKFKTTLDLLKVATTFGNGRLDPLRVELGTSAGSALLTGRVDQLQATPVVDMALNLMVDLASLRPAVNLQDTLSGRITAKATMQGPVGDPQLSLQCDYQGGTLAGVRVDRAQMKLELKDRLVHIHPLTVAVASGAMELAGTVDLALAFSEGFWSSNRNLDAVTYHLKLRGRGMNLAQLVSAPAGVSGIISATLDLDGRGLRSQKLSAQATMDLAVEKVATLAGATAAGIRLHARGVAEKGAVSVKTLQADIGDIRFQADGQLELESKAVEARLNLNAPDLKRNLAPLGITDAHGAVVMDAHLTGSVDQPRLEGNIKAEALVFRNIALGNVTVQAGLDYAGTLFVRQLNIQNQGSIVQGSGALTVFETVDAVGPAPSPVFTANLVHVDLRDFIRTNPVVGGVVKGRLQIEGSVRNPRASAELTARHLTCNAYRLGDMAARLHWNNGRLKIAPLSLENRTSTLRVTGSVQVLAPGTWNVLADPLVDIRMDAPRLTIEDFHSRYKGALTLAARLEGSATRPQGVITVAGENLDFEVQKIATAALNVQLDNEKAQIDVLRIALSPDDTVIGSGWISFDRRFGFQLSSTGVDLSRIAWLRQHQTVEGTCVFKVTGRGRFDDPEVEGNFTVKNVTLNQTPLDDFQLRVNVRNMLARISGNLDFTFDGAYDVRQKDFTLNVACRRTDLAPYFSLLEHKDFRGRLTGTLNAAGNAGALSRISATADLSELELFFNDNQLARTSGAKITFKDQTLQIPSMHLVLLEDGFLDLQGDASYNGPLNFQAAGQIPLSVLRPFSQDLSDLSGRLAVKARIGGTKTSPTANIDIGLEQVGLTIPVLTQKLQDLNGHLRITQDQIQIDDVTAQLDTGRLQLSGRIDLANFRPRFVSAAFKARILPIRIPEMMDLIVDADLNIAGTADKSGIQGEVVMLEGLYYKDFKLNLLETITKKQRAQPAPPQISSRPLLKNMSLDVALNSRSPIRVENNVARLEIQPNLRLRGRLEAPVIVGRANITTGFVRYSKKKFDITRGVVDFSNPYAIEPSVDIESQTRVRSWNIFLTILGPPDQLLLRLRSDPAEEDNDILSLLLFGRTSRELISNEKGVSQSTERILADMIAATFGEDVKHTTGLDIFELSGSGSDNVKLTLGKELSRRMTVKYEAGSKAGQMVQRAITEYKLLENIVVNGFQDIRGFFGGEFQFQMDFW